MSRGERDENVGDGVDAGRLPPGGTALLSRLGLRAGRSRRLAGDASTRRFHRLWLEGGERTLVLMEADGAFDPRRDPFCLTAAFLERAGLPVPAVVAADGAAGLVLLEDLGDLLLEGVARQEAGGPSSAPLAAGEAKEIGRPGRSLRRRYGEAIDLLVRLQDLRPLSLPRELPAARLAFDHPKLLFELEFFHRHWFGSLLDIHLARDEEQLLFEAYDAVSREVAAFRPRHFCHRDFHSRNLMVTSRGLVMVDFQDARLGPDTYDLVSLLRDAYVELGEGMERKLLAQYRERRSCGVEADASFSRRLELTAVQRNLKALGTFAFQTAVRGKPRYAGSIPATWRQAFRAFAALPELEPASRVFRRFAGEWMAGGVVLPGVRPDP